MPEPESPQAPWWARMLDALGIGLILIGLSVTVTGGFREWLPLGRVSVTSWTRPFAIGVAVLIVRHLLARKPSLFGRIASTVRHWGESPELRAIWPIYLSTRIGVLVIGFLGLVLIGLPQSGAPWRVYPNELLNLPARWDAGWYLGVALEGYEWDPRFADRQQNIAFFPVYPMLMRYGSLFLARQTLWVGVLIALVAFFLALRYCVRLARRWMGPDESVASIAFLCAYPFALFYSAPYTEALFLLTTVAACYHFERDELWKAGAWGLVAGLTRPNGCLLSIPLAFIAIRPLLKGDWKATIPRLTAAAMPGIGMLMYSAYIYTLTGNPLQWAAANAAWGRVYKGVDELVEARLNYVERFGFYSYASSQGLDLMQALAVMFVFASVVPVFRRFGLPYAMLILVNLVPPLTMGGLLSMGRVTAVVFPTFLWLGAAIPATHRSAWLIGFAMLQALCAIAFFTWRPLY